MFGGKIFKEGYFYFVMVIYVVGHKSPDSDTVCSALAVAELKRKLGFRCEARVSGKINRETKFILKKFKVKTPQVLRDAKDKDIILVDHTELSQAVDGMSEAKILGIVDHHNLGDVSTDSPPEILVRPLGSTCTIVKGLFDYYGKKIPRKIAGIMLCAILSDTVIFRSPTTTKEDKSAAKYLARIAGVKDIEGLGREMFKVKSNIDGFSPKDLVMRDFKDYEMGGKKVGIGQLELVGLKEIDAERSELLAVMEGLKKEGRYAVFLILTDILRMGSELLYVGENKKLKRKVFGFGRFGWYKGMMSRKKQVVPKLELAFSN